MVFSGCNSRPTRVAPAAAIGAGEGNRFQRRSVCGRIVRVDDVATRLGHFGPLQRRVPHERGQEHNRNREPLPDRPGRGDTTGAGPSHFPAYVKSRSFSSPRPIISPSGRDSRQRSPKLPTRNSRRREAVRNAVLGEASIGSLSLPGGSGQLTAERLGQYAVVGKLALDGTAPVADLDSPTWTAPLRPSRLPPSPRNSTQAATQRIHAPPGGVRWSGLLLRPSPSPAGLWQVVYGPKRVSVTPDTTPFYTFVQYTPQRGRRDGKPCK